MNNTDDHVIRQTIMNAASSARLGTVKSYKWLASGFISNAYELESDQGDFVLLQNKPTSVQSSDYRKYYANLKVLENAGYTHAPKAVYISDEHETIIVTKVSGRSAAEVSDLDEVDQQKVATNISTALQQLSVICKSDVDQLYGSLGLPPSYVMSGDDDWKTYVLDRFEPYKGTAPADAETEWIENAIADHPLRPHYHGVCFHHGDTSPQNVIIDDDLNVTFIDWGDSGFYESSEETEDYGLSYAFNHIAVMRKHREPILRKICKQNGQAYEEYAARIYSRSRDIKIADVVWGYWMYCQTASGAIGESPEKYKQILTQRIKEFKDQFEV